MRRIALVPVSVSSRLRCSIRVRFIPSVFLLHSIDYITQLATRCGQPFKMHYDATHGYHVRLMVPNDATAKDFPPEFNVVRTRLTDFSFCTNNGTNSIRPVVAETEFVRVDHK